MNRFLQFSMTAIIMAVTCNDSFIYAQLPLTASSKAIEPESIELNAKVLDIKSGEEKWWKVEDGRIIGGSLEETIPFNTFIAIKTPVKNFELIVKIKVEGSEGFVNSGVQIRSTRDPKSSEMVGYQCDAGSGWWGKLYDESRRNKVIAELIDTKAIEDAVRTDDFNEYRIIANGKNIQTWINGVHAIDYTETDDSIPDDGQIAFQVHGGGKTRVEIKDVRLKNID